MSLADAELPVLKDLLDLRQLQQVLEALAGVLRAELVLEDPGGQSLVVGQPSAAKPFTGEMRGPAVAQPPRPAAHPHAEVATQVPTRAREHRIDVHDPVGGPAMGRLRVIPMDPAPPGPMRLDELRLARIVAAGIGQIAAQERESRRRLAELTAVYNTSMTLAEARDLDHLLSATVRLIVDVMNVKGSSIRLIDHDRDELRIAAQFGLSEGYLQKGVIRFSTAAIDHAAMQKGHEQVPDMRIDRRVQFPDITSREGIVSMLSVAMRYRGQPVGVLRAYTGELRRFSVAEVELMKAIAAQAAAAIVNTRLAREAIEAEALERQVLMAADVQQRMIPPHAPTCPNLHFASVYVPCYELAGDLFDFIELSGDRLGVTIADVAGKGVPASLIMATVRAYLRASSEHLDDPSEMIRRLNDMLCRDNRSGEFVSLFYGVFDGPRHQLDYVLAGHLPPLLLRNGEAKRLGGNDMVLGVLPEADFTCHQVALEPGDRLLLYTDGLNEARNFNDEMFGDPRVVDSLCRHGAEDAEGLVQNLLWDMRRFVGLQRRSDDVTMIGVEVG